MIQIKEIVNSIFTSKSYILFRVGDDKAWMVDIGDIDPVVSFLEEKGLTVAGVFLTHAHFDHIYGLPELVNQFPQCKVYVTDYAKNALASDKLNLSKYHGIPIRYEGNNVVIVHDGEDRPLYEGEPLMQFYETPGHNPGCLTMVVGNMLFTGDAYIPGIGVNTQLPHANKTLSKESKERIMRLAEGRTIFPGHKILK